MAETRLDAVPASATSDPVDRLKALDAEAWRELFAAYFNRLYRFAYARTGDAQLAEEIASETFAAAARGIGRYRQTGAPFSAWLYRIARNITADRLEQRRKRPQTSLTDFEGDVEAKGWTAQVEERADIDRCLARLTQEQQDVIALRFFNDCSLIEAAAAMGKSVGAVKLLQHRALSALRKQLTRWGHQG